MLINLQNKATDTQLRWFAGLWFPAMCLMIGWMGLSRGAGRWPYALWAFGIGLGAAGLAVPRIIAPVYRGLIIATFPIGWAVSHIILRVMYYLVITPVGWLVRRFFDPMERRFRSDASSYWEPREQSAPSRYFRQF
jgi:hypothetical protein